MILKEIRKLKLLHVILNKFMRFQYERRMEWFTSTFYERLSLWFVQQKLLFKIWEKMAGLSCLPMWCHFVKSMILRFLTSMIVVQQQDLGVLALKRNYFRVVFFTIINKQLLELNRRFSEQVMDLLTLSCALSPEYRYKIFDVDTVCTLV